MKTLAILRQLEPRDRSGELPANAREATLRKHQVDITEKEDVEVVEEFGGPCRGRTYGPLIKSGNRAIIRTARCYEGFLVYR